MLTGIHTRSLEFDGQVENYAVYLPKTWDGISLLPTILYLHGWGECGTDGLRQLYIGLGRALLNHCDRWPCIIVAPQKREHDAEWLDQRHWLNEMLNIVQTAYPVDLGRCAMTGLSQGGRGTLRLADQLLWSFRALAPVCPKADPAECVEKCSGVPVWLFHGDLDEVHAVSESIGIAEALQRASSPVKLTRYAEVAHNAWDPAYETEALAEFLTDSFILPAE